MTDKLRECPFCGGEAEKYAKEIKGIKILTVTCKRCGASGQLFQSKKPRIKDEENPAIKAWNTRKPMDRIVEQLEERLPSLICGDGYDAKGRMETIIAIVKGVQND